jgi:hypothetical protein
MYYPLMQLDKAFFLRKLHDFISRRTYSSSNEPILGKNGLQVGKLESANSNVETAFTSQWTLRQQNKVGSEILPNLNNNSWQHRNQVPPKQNQMLPLRG